MRTAEAAEVTFHASTLDPAPRSREMRRGRVAIGQQVTPIGIGPPAA
jgi:hypothetical protein